MNESSRETTSVNVYKDILEHIKGNVQIKNLSQWINTTYPKEFMNLEKETKNLNFHLREAEKSKEKIKKLKKIKQNIFIPKEAERWLKEEALQRLNKIAIPGLLKYFNTTFELKFNLRQFRLLINKAQKESKVKK